ncbi:MAG: M12 family metallo-peptidase [Xanthomonadaceae bacterium]|nr:M12 family metallo-peptidase [Xanthomonadaceae bacterium]
MKINYRLIEAAFGTFRYFGTRLSLFSMLAGLFFIPALALAAERGSLRDFERLTLAAPSKMERQELTVRAFDQVWKLKMHDNKRLFGLLSADKTSALQSGDDRFFAGQVGEIEHSWLRLNWVDGHWSGAFHDGHELYLIDRRGSLALPAGRRAGPAQDIVYRFSDLDLGPILGHDPLLHERRSGDPMAADYNEFVDHLREIALQGDALFLMPITVVTDTQFGSTFGDSTASVVAARINFIDGIYASQLGTGIALFHHETLANNDTLTGTGASELLNQFRSFMRTGNGSDIPFRGLGHLFTSRPRDGSIAGIAFLGVLCSTSAGYGVDWNLSNETTNGLVFAHEVGHNFNAPHDGDPNFACGDEDFPGIMRPSISNSRQEFSPCSLDQMAAATAGASCLIENTMLEVLFRNGFEG